MRLTVVNACRNQKANRPGLTRLLEFLLHRASPGNSQRWNDITLVLADNTGMQRINRTHLGHDYPTDVIAFTYLPMQGSAESAPSGELYVNLELACELGSRFKSSAHELALYVAHGCDHLAGGEDCNPVLRRRMRRRELRWLAEASQLHLLAGLVRP
jgi:probable rRNA maturation factor